MILNPENPEHMSLASRVEAYSVAAGEHLAECVTHGGLVIQVCILPNNKACSDKMLFSRVENNPQLQGMISTLQYTFTNEMLTFIDTHGRDIPQEELIYAAFEGFMKGVRAKFEEYDRGKGVKDDNECEQ